MTTIAVGSANVMQRIRHMLAAMAVRQRAINETRYQPPQIWRRGMRLQPNLHYARPAKHHGADDGRPKGMSGRQWKRLKKAEHRVANHTHLIEARGGPNAPITETFLDGRPVRSRKDAHRAAREYFEGRRSRRIIQLAHNSCDQPSPGHPYIGGRRLRTLIEL